MARSNLLILPVVGALACTPINVQAIEQVSNLTLSDFNLQAGFNDSLLPQMTKEELLEKELNDIEYLKTDDKKTYLHEFYNIVAKYEFDPPETIYDICPTDEIILFAKLVEAEATSGDFDSKCNVASVVLNRVHSDEFPNTITEVILQKKPCTQFSPMSDGRINQVEITENSLKAIEYVFLFGDTSQLALYFDNATNSWSSKTQEYIFTDSLNHSFYK